MDIRLVDQHHAALGLAFDRPDDPLVRGEGAGRVVRVADIDQPGVALRGGEHALDVVGRLGVQRHGSDLRPWAWAAPTTES